MKRTTFLNHRVQAILVHRPDQRPDPLKPGKPITASRFTRQSIRERRSNCEMKLNSAREASLFWSRIRTLGADHRQKHSERTTFGCASGCPAGRWRARGAVFLFCSVFFLVTGTTRLAADHNKLLQREFRSAISRHVACDSQGYCYLLLPSPGSEGGQGL